MRAAVRSISSPDVEDLATWRPDADGWSIRLRILVGPTDEDGEESFDLTVCDVAGLAARVRSERVVDGRHHLIVDGFDWPAIVQFVEQRVRSLEAASWAELAAKVSRLAHWEFEDYQPADGGR